MISGNIHPLITGGELISSTVPSASSVNAHPNLISHYSALMQCDLLDGQSAFTRGSQVVRPDNALLPNNMPAIYGGYNWLEASATSYYAQTYTTSASGIITTDAPITRTVTLPATGAYVLWVSGNASLSVTIAAGTAVGSGFGTLTASGFLPLTITTAGTVTVTVANGAAGDQVQLTTGAVKTSYIPTPTTSPVTRASAGADVSGNGLSLALNRQMLDSLTGGVSDWTAAWTTVSGAPTYSGGNKVLTYSAMTATDYHALLSAGVSVGHTVEIGYTISGYSAGSFNFGFGSGQAV